MLAPNPQTIATMAPSSSPMTRSTWSIDARSLADVVADHFGCRHPRDLGAQRRCQREAITGDRRRRGGLAFAPVEGLPHLVVPVVPARGDQHSLARSDADGS